MRAESVTVESNETGFELHFIVDEEPRVEEWGHMWINIQACDLDAFYDQVKSRIGPYLRERDEVRGTGVRVTKEDLDGYDFGDPKRIELERVIERGGWA